MNSRDVLVTAIREMNKNLLSQTLAEPAERRQAVKARTFTRAPRRHNPIIIGTSDSLRVWGSMTSDWCSPRSVWPVVHLFDKSRLKLVSPRVDPPVRCCVLKHFSRFQTPHFWLVTSTFVTFPSISTPTFVYHPSRLQFNIFVCRH